MSFMDIKYYIDGDMPMPFVKASVDLCGYWNVPEIFRLQPATHKLPKALVTILKTSWAIYHPINCYRAKKETTDKKILMEIQKQICLGVRKFYVFANDRDFWYDCGELMAGNPSVEIIVVNFAEKIKVPKGCCEVEFVDVKSVRSLEDQLRRDHV